MLVPQALAYATIAGLDPVYGLYAAAAAPLAAALVGSSPYIQTGPTAVTSLLTLGALGAVAEPNGVRYALLAAVLAIIVGIVRVGLGLAGAGPIAYLMSQPVVVSFTSASALLIIGTQVPGILGVSSTEQNPLLGAISVLAEPGAWSLVDLALGTGAMALMLGGRRLWSLFPGALVAVLVAVIWSRRSGYDGSVVGGVVLDLRGPTGVSFTDATMLLVPGVVIALIGFAEPASIARRYAAMDRKEWDPNREFVGQGFANLASGLVGGFPVGGSFSRTALNRLSGARTRWSGAVTGLAVLALLPFTALLAPLPLSVLAGLVIGAVVSLVDTRTLLLYWGWSRPQFFVGIVTIIATMTFAPRVDRGLLLGVAAALAVHLWRELRVGVPSRLDGDTLHVRPSGVLYFGSAPAVEQTVNALLAKHPEVRRLVLHLDAIGRLDLTGALMLRDVLEDLDAAGREVQICGARAHSARLLTRVLGIPITADDPKGDST